MMRMMWMKPRKLVVNKTFRLLIRLLLLLTILLHLLVQLQLTRLLHPRVNFSYICIFFLVLCEGRVPQTFIFVI